VGRRGQGARGHRGLIGVLFSAALAVGSMTTSGEELIEALLGGAGALSWPEAVFGLAASVGVVVFVVSQRYKLLVILVSPEVARKRESMCRV
jgi:ABC-type Mn2+/Zn2+ transport system permease subunit